MELSRRLEHLVIVTNNVFEDGICYDRETMNYMKALGNLSISQRDDLDRVLLEKLLIAYVRVLLITLINSLAR